MLADGEHHHMMVEQSANIDSVLHVFTRSLICLVAHVHHPVCLCIPFRKSQTLADSCSVQGLHAVCCFAVMEMMSGLFGITN